MDKSLFRYLYRVVPIHLVQIHVISLNQLLAEQPRTRASNVITNKAAQLQDISNVLDRKVSPLLSIHVKPVKDFGEKLPRLITSLV